ncbi:hypothetical protein [Leptolyngbya sp. BC1307]|uniref:hypothetical protein n=1 Tax=Leptolyngbya sp. BC1307 TaxID=2029589 RepID=UPI001F0AE83B|nr:hypothetical protein [Leptolyngbya sp. BC1307]
MVKTADGQPKISQLVALVAVAEQAGRLQRGGAAVGRSSVNGESCDRYSRS